MSDSDERGTCDSPPCKAVGPFRYCPVKGCGWMEETPPEPWEVLRGRLQDRLTMARHVLDEQGHEGVAALVPIEEVLIWMDEIEGDSGSPLHSPCTGGADSCDESMRYVCTAHLGRNEAES